MIKMNVKRQKDYRKTESGLSSSIHADPFRHSISFNNFLFQLGR